MWIGFRLGCECRRWCGKMKEKKWTITMEALWLKAYYMSL